MNMDSDKVMALDEAIRMFVRPGCHLSIGGFTISRNPMAAVYEIMRQRIKDIHCYAHSNGTGVDELIGAGCISKLDIAYGGKRQGGGNLHPVQGCDPEWRDSI